MSYEPCKDCGCTSWDEWWMTECHTVLSCVEAKKEAEELAALKLQIETLTNSKELWETTARQLQVERNDALRLVHELQIHLREQQEENDQMRAVLGRKQIDIEYLELRKLAWACVGEVGMNDTLRPMEEFLNRTHTERPKYDPDEKCECGHAKGDHGTASATCLAPSLAVVSGVCPCQIFTVKRKDDCPRCGPDTTCPSCASVDE